MEPEYVIINPLYNECPLIQAGKEVSSVPTQVETARGDNANLVVIEMEPITPFFGTPAYSEAKSSALLEVAGDICESCPLFVYNGGECMPIPAKRIFDSSTRPQPVIKTNWVQE